MGGYVPQGSWKGGACMHEWYFAKDQGMLFIHQKIWSYRQGLDTYFPKVCMICSAASSASKLSSESILWNGPGSVNFQQKQRALLNHIRRQSYLTNSLELGIRCLSRITDQLAFSILWKHFEYWLSSSFSSLGYVTNMATNYSGTRYYGPFFSRIRFPGFRETHISTVQ